MKRTIITLFACIALSIGYGQNNPCPGVTADFSGTADLAAGGINFTNASQLVPNESYSFSWDFGNGEVSNDESPFCMFEEGIFQVTLTVMGPNGCQSAVNKDIEFSYNGQ